jgi:hypothetical protein
LHSASKKSKINSMAYKCKNKRAGIAMLHTTGLIMVRMFGIQFHYMLTKIKNNYWSAVVSSAFGSSALSASLSASIRSRVIG